MSNSFANKSFLFTGKLAYMKREEAEAKVEALGGKVASSVTKTLSVLVATSETDAKWTKAQELNVKGAQIQFWTEDQFMAELEKADAVNSNADTKDKKIATKCSKFEDMRPFIIEIETINNNVWFKCKINSKNCKEEDIEYEVLCSDSKEEYQLLQGNKAFKHYFKQQGKYKISFRGNLPGLLIRDGNSYHIIDVCQWGDIGWLNMDRMFKCCHYFNISADDQPDLSRVTSLKEMFYDAKSMNALLENWDVSKVTNMDGLFCCAHSFNQPLEKWDVSKVTNMDGLFCCAHSFNQPLEKWDVSNVTDMSGMFCDASSFNQPLEKWDVSNVTDMSGMFCGASSFNQPLEKWDVSNVTDMLSMFYSASSFNQPLEKWDVSNVTVMSCMFYSASSFNQPLEKWDVSKVTKMEGMFCRASSFNQPLEKWDVSNVTDMSLMFGYTSSFNQPLEKWDVSNVTDISSMFSHTSSFNQPLEKWNVSKVMHIGLIFMDAVAMKNLPSWLNNINIDNKYNIEDNDETMILELSYPKNSTVQYSVNDNISDIKEVFHAFENGDTDTLAEIAELGEICDPVCPIWDDPVKIYYSIKFGDKELSNGTLTVDSNDEFEYCGNELELMLEPDDRGDNSYILISVDDLKWSVSEFFDVSSDIEIHKGLLIDTRLLDRIKETDYNDSFKVDSLYEELFGKMRIQVNALYFEEMDDQYEADNQKIEVAERGTMCALLKYNPEETIWEVIYLLKKEFPATRPSVRRLKKRVGNDIIEKVFVDDDK